MTWFLLMQNELVELFYAVFQFAQDRITGTELYVLMKISYIQKNTYEITVFTYWTANSKRL